MISQISGTLVAKSLERVEILTTAGVTYELLIPLSVYEALPGPGAELTLHAHLVVRDDAWMLFGFTTPLQKRLFQRLLSASGVGPALAVNMLSALTAERLVRAIIEKDVAALQRIPRVGRKTAERLVLDLADKMDDVQGDGTAPRAGAGGSAEDAVRALVSLGYAQADADRAVRAALDTAPPGTAAPELIRRALTTIGGRR
jgi:Holliday junction DNA helicase RuvA